MDRREPKQADYQNELRRGDATVTEKGRPQLRWEYCVKIGVRERRGKIRGGEKMLQCEKKQWRSSSVQDANVTSVKGNHDKEQRYV